MMEIEDDYQRYRREQEEAVSNKSGSTAGEVFFVIFPNICSVLLTLTTIKLYSPQITRGWRFIMEFCLMVIPCILCCTVLSGKVGAISLIFLIVSAGNILSILGFKMKDTFKCCPGASSSKLPFVTNFRALTNIMTAVCILAVDFRCFPREFAKTEKYGYSLMDTGVGLFIVANALVAPEARHLDASTRTLFFQRLLKTLKDCLPLLVLGVGRFVAVEVLSYQKHVTEYGVHWNFFLTLASIKLFTGVLSKSLSSKYSFLTGLWILIMHEYALSTKGLKEWVLSNEPRNDFLSANREGWVSIPGYVGLYLISIGIGRIIHSTYQSVDNQLVFHIKLSSYQFHIGYTRSMYLTVKLYLIASVAFISTYYCEQYFRVSRRLANSGYCAWTITLSILILTFLLLTEVILECITSWNREKPRRKIAKHLRKDDLNAEESINIVKTLEIFEVVNENGLFFFLCANLLTGMVNMNVKTLRVDEPEAVFIIIVYMAVNLLLVLLFCKLKNNHTVNAKKNN